MWVVKTITGDEFTITKEMRDRIRYNAGHGRMTMWIETKNKSLVAFDKVSCIYKKKRVGGEVVTPPPPDTVARRKAKEEADKTKDLDSILKTVKEEDVK